MLQSLPFLGLFASVVAGHGVVDSFKTDGVEHPGYQLSYYYDKKNGKELPELAAWSAENLDSGFVAPENYTSPDIVCQKNGVSANSTVKVSAGGTVEFHWTRWAHFGPMMTYIARCPSDDCTDVDKTALEFVKIDEAGINFDTQEWAARTMVNNNNTWVTTVPKSLAAGSYVFRRESIAVHGSLREGGAQNYPQCFNIEVTGSGTAEPKGVRAQELYTPTDPGILFNFYKTPIQNYTIPGPALFRDGEAATATSTAPTTPSDQPLVNNATSRSFANSTVHVPIPSRTPPKPAGTLSTKLVTVIPTSRTTETAIASSSASLPATPKTGPSVQATQPVSSSACLPIGSEFLTSKADADAVLNGGDSLPQTFTLETFIERLRENSSKNTRRHPRELL
ncbi:glycosyl hydrolase family 61 [Colletotrichum chrysophilum]|uniref:lytic cellulose monooxygenase (C4-dehydrogenating) n=1 Tax=Colletotrichum chrysophilum TaxID=1836956 RepID=A0AAD9ASN3_9PEZI|nr:glycosyl hydrolase family 61 [Colletotrichum chrysophilum]